MPNRFTNDHEPPAADAPRRADAAACASEPGADTATATPHWFADFLIDRPPANRRRTRSRPTGKTSPRWPIY